MTLERAIQLAIVATIVTSCSPRARSCTGSSRRARSAGCAARARALALALAAPRAERVGPRAPPFARGGSRRGRGRLGAWSAAPSLTLGRAVSLALVLVVAVRAERRAESPELVLQGVLFGAAAVAVGGLLVLAFDYDRAVQAATTVEPARYQGLGGGPNMASMVFALAAPLAPTSSGLADAAAARGRGRRRSSLLARLGRRLRLPRCARRPSSPGSPRTRSSRGGRWRDSGGPRGRRRWCSRCCRHPRHDPAASRPGRTRPRRRSRPRRATSTRTARPAAARRHRPPRRRGRRHAPARAHAARDRADARRRGAERSGWSPRRPVVGYGFGTEDRTSSTGTCSSTRACRRTRTSGSSSSSASSASSCCSRSRSRSCGPRPPRSSAVAAAATAAFAGALALALSQSYLYAPGNAATITAWVCAFAAFGRRRRCAREAPGARGERRARSARCARRCRCVGAGTSGGTESRTGMRAVLAEIGPLDSQTSRLPDLREVRLPGVRARPQRLRARALHRRPRAGGRGDRPSRQGQRRSGAFATILRAPTSSSTAVR